MFFQTSRKAVAVLLVATAVALSCAAPSQATPYQPRRASDERAWAGPGRSLTGFLLELFAFLGGALDPNGQH